MASIAHIALGLAAGRRVQQWLDLRPAWLFTAWLILASCLPDLDVLHMVFRLPFRHPWGHRGASHSVCLALLVGGVVAGLLFGMNRFRSRHLPALSLGAYTTLMMLSHLLIDAFSQEGIGLMPLWPFSEVRPVHALPIIPVAHPGADFRFAPLMLEALCFWPFWLYAFWPRNRRRYRLLDSG